MYLKDMQSLGDKEVLALYGVYSEEIWAAGSMDASEDVVHSFIDWLAREGTGDPRPLWESAILITFRLLVKQRQGVTR